MVGIGHFLNILIFKHNYEGKPGQDFTAYSLFQLVVHFLLMTMNYLTITIIITQSNSKKFPIFSCEKQLTSNNNESNK